MAVANLAHLLTRSAARAPQATAVLHGERRLSYAELDARTGRLAAALLGLGLARGDRVGLIVETEPRALECLLAPMRAGLCIVPMNPRLHIDEYEFMLRHAGAGALILSAARQAELAPLAGRVPGLRIIAMDAAADGLADYERLLAAAAPMPDAEVSADDPAWIFYTSGTTGRPKGATHTHRSLGAMVAAHLIEICPMLPDDRLVHLTPMSHAAGLLSLHQTAGGGAHVFPTFKGFSAEAFHRLVAEARVTKAILVPTMIQRLLEAPWPCGHDLSSLATVIYGAAPMPVERLREALRRYGPIFVQIYAQGEAPLACSWLGKDEHAARDAAGIARLASAGRAAYGAELRIVDAEDRPAPVGVPGEIAVRGDVVMRDYWNDPAASAETLRGGWLHTGDIGHLDAAGYLFVTDRLKDMIIKGGTNIYPREIEELLYRHEAVREATVFGVPDAEWGERVVGAVVPNEGATLDEAALIAWLKARMTPFKAPSRLHLVAELPKNGYGKIMKREARALLYPPPAKAEA